MNDSFIVPAALQDLPAVSAFRQDIFGTMINTWCAHIVLRLRNLFPALRCNVADCGCADRRKSCVCKNLSLTPLAYLGVGHFLRSSEAQLRTPKFSNECGD